MRHVFRRLGGALSCLAFALPACAPAAFAAPQITIVGAQPRGIVPFVAVTTEAFAGAAAAWKPIFEAGCGCVVEIRRVEDASAVSGALAGAAPADVVVGLPLSALEEARGTGKFAPHGQPAPLSLPVAWSDPTFMPIDYGWLGFVYDTTRLTQAPVSFAEIAKAGPKALRVAVDDPRLSATGLDALAWMRATQKDAAGALWEGMKPKLVVARSRAQALGWLETGEVDLALASTSWPATQAGDGAPKYKATPFREGQFLQIETAAMVAGAAHPQIAAQFLAFLVTPEAQAQIAARRGMYPVHPAAALPASFGKLTLPSWSISLTAQEMAAQRGAWLAEWDRAMGR